jgi:hypothetical protein
MLCIFLTIVIFPLTLLFHENGSLIIRSLSESSYT